MGKDASSTAIIGSTDGPTAVAVIKRNPKLTFGQKIRKLIYTAKRNHVVKNIKAESHSMEEVMEYIVNKHRFLELDSSKVQQEYKEMRASLLMQHVPELLGEYATMPKLKSESTEDIQAHIKSFQERQQRAKDIPTADFDIDFHKFQSTYENSDNNMYITVEKRFSYIGGGVSGSKKSKKRFQRIYKDVYRYYGVTCEDIENKSKRYEQLIQALTR